MDFLAVDRQIMRLANITGCNPEVPALYGEEEDDLPNVGRRGRGDLAAFTAVAESGSEWVDLPSVGNREGGSAFFKTCL